MSRLARATALLEDAAGCAIIAAPPGEDFGRRLAARLAPGQVMCVSEAGLGEADEDWLEPQDHPWPGIAPRARQRRRRIDTLADRRDVGLIALPARAAPAILAGAAATIARCRPVLLLDCRGCGQVAPPPPGYAAVAEGPHRWMVPPGIGLAPAGAGSASIIETVFDGALDCAGLHPPEPDAPDGGRWTGSAPQTGFWMPRPALPRCTLRLAIADWGNAAPGFAARIDGVRLAPRRMTANALVYASVTLDPLAAPGVRIALFPPRPTSDQERWPRKIGVRILAARLDAR